MHRGNDHSRRDHVRNLVDFLSRLINGVMAGLGPATHDFAEISTAGRGWRAIRCFSNESWAVSRGPVSRPPSHTPSHHGFGDSSAKSQVPAWSLSPRPRPAIRNHEKRRIRARERRKRAAIVGKPTRAGCRTETAIVPHIGRPIQAANLRPAIARAAPATHAAIPIGERRSGPSHHRQAKNSASQHASHNCHHKPSPSQTTHIDQPAMNATHRRVPPPCIPVIAPETLPRDYSRNDHAIQR
jgi:hypothetical protein